MHAIVILTSIASSSTSGSVYSRGSSGVSIAVQTIALPVSRAMSLSLHVIREVYPYRVLEPIAIFDRALIVNEQKNLPEPVEARTSAVVHPSSASPREPQRDRKGHSGRLARRRRDCA